MVVVMDGLQKKKKQAMKKKIDDMPLLEGHEKEEKEKKSYVNSKQIIN